MQPSDYMRGCQNKLVHIGLQNGDLYSGTLVECDNWMNMTLRIVTKTSGNETTHIPEVLLRGGFVRFMCMPPDIGELVRKTREEATGSASRVPFTPPAQPVRGSPRGGGTGGRGASEGRGGYYRGGRGDDRSRGHYR